MADPPLTAALQQIQADAELAAKSVVTSAGTRVVTRHVPALLAALRAALKHHPQMITVDGTVCAMCSRRYPPTLYPCPEVEAITRALTGKEDGGA